MRLCNSGIERLAALLPEGYVLWEEFCADEALPRHFVAKILQDLVRKGLLISAKAGVAVSRWHIRPGRSRCMMLLKGLTARSGWMNVSSAWPNVTMNSPVRSTINGRQGGKGCMNFSRQRR
jgi:hypothetical protein